MTYLYFDVFSHHINKLSFVLDFHLDLICC
jgi:hypothetical protein